MDVPQALRDDFESRFPIEGEGFTLELLEFTAFDWGTGLQGQGRLIKYDAAGQLEGIIEETMDLLRAEDLVASGDVVDAALDAWIARVRAMTRDEVAQCYPSDLGPWAEQGAEALEAAFTVWMQATWPETPPGAALRRQSALAKAHEALPALREHVQAVWGLTLPRGLEVLWAFHLAMESAPSVVREAPGVGVGGIFDRLQPGGWDRAIRDGLDERLHIRFRADPPEMLTIGWGGSDGQHFGLWFTDATRCAGVVHNYARDSAETWFVGASPLSMLRQRWAYDAPAEDATGFADRAFLEELAWWEARDPTVASESLPPGELLGGPMCDPPARLPGTVETRASAYRTDETVTRGWLADARVALAAGDPAQALALGRELHWFDGDAYRVEAGELLVDAYRALGRDALADILRVHLMHRDLRSAGVLA